MPPITEEIKADPIRRTLYSAASTVDIIAYVDDESVKSNMTKAVITMLEGVISALKGKETAALVEEPDYD
jgi:hypothetical protein